MKEGIGSQHCYIAPDNGFHHLGEKKYINYFVGGTSFIGHLCQEVTSQLRTPKFNLRLFISIKFDLCNRDTSQLRTAFVSRKGSTFVINYFPPSVVCLVDKHVDVVQQEVAEVVISYSTIQKIRGRCVRKLLILIECVMT
jgi:hypothetical protein